MNSDEEHPLKVQIKVIPNIPPIAAFNQQTTNQTPTIEITESGPHYLESVLHHDDEIANDQHNSKKDSPESSTVLISTTYRDSKVRCLCIYFVTDPNLYNITVL